jgi:von Willebrand factor type A domain
MKPLSLVLLCVAASFSSHLEQQPAFSARTELVRVDVLTTDDRGSIADLQVEDFEVFDNGVPQRIDRVLSDDSSLEAWLILDQSGSVQGQVEELEDAARTFLAQLTNRDRAGLLTFRHGVTMHFGLSPLPRIPEGFSEIRAEGYTSLRDAIAVALALRDQQMDRDGARAQRRHGHHELVDGSPVVRQRRAFRSGYLRCGNTATPAGYIRRKISAAHSGGNWWARCPSQG